MANVSSNNPPRKRCCGRVKSLRKRQPRTPPKTNTNPVKISIQNRLTPAQNKTSFVGLGAARTGDVIDALSERILVNLGFQFTGSDDFQPLLLDSWAAIRHDKAKIALQ